MITRTEKAQVPKVKLLDEPAVVDLLNKRVAAAEKQAAIAANRTYRNIIRSAKEAIGTFDLEPKQRKALAAHLTAALAEHAPAQAAE